MIGLYNHLEPLYTNRNICFECSVKINSLLTYNIILYRFNKKKPTDN